MDNGKYSISPEYVDFLKKNEGLDFKPYDSREGGTPTVGFGHKLTKEEIKSGKVYGFDLKSLGEEEANAILMADLAAKQDSLNTRLMKKFNISLEELDPEQKEMLLDYEFNTGDVLTKFPKFTKAVIDNDVATMRKEYVRKVTDPKSGKKVPLGMRNETFYARYLAPKQDQQTPASFAMSDDPWQRLIAQAERDTGVYRNPPNAQQMPVAMEEENSLFSNPLTDWMRGFR